MISRLEHCDTEIADHIYAIFQASYKIEAQLIGVTHFPPLSRTAADIAKSNSAFYGFYEQGALAAVVEVLLNLSVGRLAMG